MVFSAFTELCSHHLQFQHISLPRKRPCSYKQSLATPHPSPWTLLVHLLLLWICLFRTLHINRVRQYVALWIWLLPLIIPSHECACQHIPCVVITCLTAFLPRGQTLRLVYFWCRVQGWHTGALHACLLNERCFSYSSESGWAALGAPYTHSLHPSQLGKFLLALDWEGSRDILWHEIACLGQCKHFPFLGCCRSGWH